MGAKMKTECKAAVWMTVLVMAVMSGCGSAQKTERENTVLSLQDEENGDGAQQSRSDEEDTGMEGLREADEGEESPSVSPSEDIGADDRDTEIIGGKVRSIAEDSFVISRVLMDDSYVIIPEPGSPEEELVTIRCTDFTTYELWTIQGGGAGIEKEAAAFSDIREDGGLEASGYFDGEEFVAETVFIEIYE